MSENINPREIALDVLMKIDKNSSFSNTTILSALKKHQFSSKQDRAFITRICEGVMEYRIKLDYIINQFSKVKVNKCKPLIRNILRIGVYQIIYMDSVPDTAACNESVKLAKKRGFTNLSGFVNGVLRNIARNVDNIKFPEEENDRLEYLSISYSMPKWLVEKFVLDYGYDIAKKMLEASVMDRPTTIRCNETNISINDLVDKLKNKDINVNKGYYVDSALLIDNYDYIRRVPGFIDGEFVVQDESSMLVGLVANPSKEDMIVDVCGAPGGKTLHIADILGGKGHIITRDLSENKVDLIKDNIDRCNFENINVSVYDATCLDEDLVGKADIVIADLPCSGLGIIGKKNDIKYRVDQKQLDDLVALQRRILDIVSKYVKKGGALVFSTCTVNVDENIENVKWFIDNYDFKLDNIEKYLPKSILDVDSSYKEDGYITIIPGIYMCDGFFIARLIRN